ncbi:hypothetical protein [Sagittula sp.]|uniref:hypothetical protein n=1 Tax=Sagittula sp. TaxID=2038081 RepID=UPI0035167536
MPEDLGSGFAAFKFRSSDRNTSSDDSAGDDFDLMLQTAFGDAYGSFDQSVERSGDTTPTTWEGDVPPDLSDDFDFLL